jgi:transcriptional regulator with XRE-family HTH domain
MGMEQLSTYLTDNSIKQKDFAERLGVSNAYMSQILNGRRRPSFDLMCKIAAESDQAVPLNAWQMGDVA